MANFDWRTGEEDDERWDEPFDGGAERPSFKLPHWLKRWGPWLGGFLVLLVVIGFVLANLFDRQVEEVEETTNSDLLAIHELVREAIDDQDFELLETLTDKDNNWRNLQLDLLNVHLVLDRWPLGLELLPETVVSVQHTPTITLSSDLQTAEITEPLPYRITTGDRISETVWLEQTYYYKRQDDSWLWSAPPDDVDYWGKWHTTEYGDNLILIYSDRDKPFADYLGVRLNELVGRVCDDEVLDCPGAFQVEFRLVRRPDSLSQLNDSYFNVNLRSSQSVYIFEMPSPTIIGRPLQESDYDVLYQGYANWLAAGITVRYWTGGGTFDGNPFELILAKWDLEAPPTPVVPMPIPQNVEPPPIPFPEQDVIISCSGFDAMSLLRYNPRDNKWLDEMNRLQLEDFILRFSSQLDGQSFSGSEINVLLDDSGVLTSFNLFDGEDHRAYLFSLIDGELNLWLEEDFFLQLIPDSVQRQFDRNGRKLVVFEYLFVEDEGGGQQTLVPYAIDLEACQAGNCTLEPYAGIPHWSPDLNWAFLVDSDTQFDLSLQNEETGEVVELGNGFSPYWLDNERFVYITSDESQGQSGESGLVSVVQATVSQPLSGTVLFDSAEILEVVGREPETPIGITSVVAHPDQPDWYFISVNGNLRVDPVDFFVLAYRADIGTFQILVEESASAMYAPFSFIQDGRFLRIQSFNAISTQSFSSTPQTEYTLVPLDPEQKTTGSDIQSFSAFQSFRDDISADERWMLILEQGNLRLIAPGYDYSQTLAFNRDFCYQAFWVNPIGP